jgi:hypothetical protein
MRILVGLLFAAFAAVDFLAHGMFKGNRAARGYGRTFFGWSSNPQAWLLASAISFLANRNRRVRGPSVKSASPNSALQRTRAAVLLQPVPRKKVSIGGSMRAPLSFKTLGGPKRYRISRSPGRHVSQAGRGEQRSEVSREDRLPTR